MTQKTIATGQTATGLAPILFAALLGFGIVFAAGFGGAQVLHDAAHDTRHATGFPCH